MAKTLTRQMRVMPTGASTLPTDEGEGMHTRIVYDAIDDLNNLWGYVNLRLGYVQSNQGQGDLLTVSGDTGGATREVFAGQVPTFVPIGAARMLWTMGVTAQDTAGAGMTISQIKLYLSRTPYIGTSAVKSPTTFSAVPLSTDNVSRAKTVNIVAPAASSSAYTLVDDSTTGLTPPRQWQIFGENDWGAWLIVTATVNSSNAPDTGSLAVIHDFSWWFLME